MPIPVDPGSDALSSLGATQPIVATTGGKP
jgi:hypothetical protein